MLSNKNLLHMKVFNVILSLLFSVCAVSAQEWQLSWSEEFEGPELDSAVWSRTTPGNADWAKEQSPLPELVQFRDGAIVLRGIVNPDTEAQPTRFVCGGVVSKGKKEVPAGARIEVRAKLEGAKGAWPAIWLMPSDFGDEGTPEWPITGEIDIMERLNNNHFVYQTVHSNYTQNLGRTANPKASVTSPIDRDDWNVYGAEIHPDEIVFLVNGEVTNRYPRVAEEADNLQFPFYHPWYILLDMQMEGAWVGEGDPGDLPVEMLIDWVRIYEPTNNK